MLAKWIKYENKRQTSQKETKKPANALYAKILNVIENNKYELVGVAMKIFRRKTLQLY